MERDLEVAAGYISWENLNMLMGAYHEVAQRAKIQADVLMDTFCHVMSALDSAEATLRDLTTRVISALHLRGRVRSVLGLLVSQGSNVLPSLG